MPYDVMQSVILGVYWELTWLELLRCVLIQTIIMLSVIVVIVNMPLCFVSFCRVSLCWISYCWSKLCRVAFFFGGGVILMSTIIVSVVIMSSVIMLCVILLSFIILRIANDALHFHCTFVTIMGVIFIIIVRADIFCHCAECRPAKSHSAREVSFLSIFFVEKRRSRFKFFLQLSFLCLLPLHVTWLSIQQHLLVK